MALDKAKIENFGDSLFEAMTNRTVIEPITDQAPDIEIADAYKISQRFLERRLAAGETMIGKKIGVTSAAVMSMLNVHQPDFGFLTDKMVYGTSAEVPASTAMIAPKAEGEIAFVLKDELSGPGVTNADVIAATDFVMPCFEIVDSRIRDWKIKIQDTVADNASCGVFVVSEQSVSPSAIDLAASKVTVHKNGKFLSEGLGEAVQGSPLNAVAWLANTLNELGAPLQAGELVLSGSLVPLEPIVVGDDMTMDIPGIGSLTANFVE